MRLTYYEDKSALLVYLLITVCLTGYLIFNAVNLVGRQERFVGLPPYYCLPFSLQYIIQYLILEAVTFWWIQSLPSRTCMVFIQISPWVNDSCIDGQRLSELSSFLGVALFHALPSLYTANGSWSAHIPFYKAFFFYKKKLFFTNVITKCVLFSKTVFG